MSSGKLIQGSFVLNLMYSWRGETDVQMILQQLYGYSEKGMEDLHDAITAVFAQQSSMPQFFYKFLFSQLYVIYMMMGFCLLISLMGFFLVPLKRFERSLENWTKKSCIKTIINVVNWN
jgi:uncharacterized BrkB/YihY/UPF0761 family membrane protein